MEARKESRSERHRRCFHYDLIALRRCAEADRSGVRVVQENQPDGAFEVANVDFGTGMRFHRNGP